MPLDFPTSPTNGQVYDQWQWDGAKWVAIVGTLPAGPAGPTGPPGVSAGRIFYYDATDASDIAGYAKLLASPSANPEKTIAVACTGVGVDFAVEEFITDAGVPGAVDYPAGTAYRRIYAHVNSGTARLHLRIYIRTAAGVETLVRDEVSPDFTDQTVALQEWVASAPAGGAMLATDRIVNKLSAQRVTGGGGTVTVTCHFEGTTTGSHIQTTIATGGSLAGMTAGQIPIAASATAISASANLSGDVTSNATLATTLATVNGNVGTFQGITVNGKGLVTAAANQSYAPLASPTFTGTPTLPTGTIGVTQAAANNTTALATTAYVQSQAYAPLASPTFTGAPTLPTGTIGVTQAAATNNTTLATTAYVKSQAYVTGGPYLPLSGGALSGALSTTSDLSIGLSSSTTVGLEIAPGRGADGSSLIDFHAAAGAADYDFRILRSTGTNGAVDILNLGTGAVNITTGGALRATFSTAASGAVSLTLPQCLAAQGILSRQGIAGPTGANVWNIHWSGSAAQYWVDGANVGNITITSDYRVKENVADLPPMWDRVKALRPISYTIKENAELLTKSDPLEQWGFIAHELQETLIESASTGHKDAPDTIQSPNIMVLVAPLTRALQEAMARIEELEARFDALPPFGPMVTPSGGD